MGRKGRSRDVIKNVLAALVARGGTGTFAEIRESGHDAGWNYTASTVANNLKKLELQHKIGHVGRTYFTLDDTNRLGYSNELLTSILTNLDQLTAEQSSFATALLLSGLARTFNAVEDTLRENGKELRVVPTRSQPVMDTMDELAQRKIVNGETVNGKKEAEAGS